MSCKRIRPFDGYVPVGQWLANRTGIPRQTLLSAADTGRLRTDMLADGTRVVHHADLLQYIATHRPKGKRR